MDFEQKLKHVEQRSNQIAQESTELREKYESATKFTAEFLASCEAKGITKVAIGKSHKSVPSSIRHPFGASGSVFSFQPKEAASFNGWPPIWAVVSEMGVSAGCGNTDQHQADLSGLIDGVYHRKNGHWHRVDD